MTKPPAPTHRGRPRGPARPVGGSGQAGRDRPRRPPDRFLYGLHPVRAALMNPDRPCHRIMCLETALAEVEAVCAAARATGLVRPSPQPLPRERLERLLPPGAVHQGMVVEVGPLPPVDLDDLGRMAEARADGALVVALDQVTDPHNVGAVIRSAASFGALGVVVTDRHAPEITGVLARSASGGVERVPIVRVTNLAAALDSLAGWGFLRVGLDEHADPLLPALPRRPRTALVLGAEGTGLRHKTKQTCDALARLPTVPDFPSLNVSNAAAVALYELVRGRADG